MKFHLWVSVILGLGGTAISSYWRFAQAAPDWTSWVGSVLFLVGMGLLLHRPFRTQAVGKDFCGSATGV